MLSLLDLQCVECVRYKCVQLSFFRHFLVFRGSNFYKHAIIYVLGYSYFQKNEELEPHISYVYPYLDEDEYICEVTHWLKQEKMFACIGF